MSDRVNNTLAGLQLPQTAVEGGQDVQAAQQQGAAPAAAAQQKEDAQKAVNEGTRVQSEAQQNRPQGTFTLQQSSDEAERNFAALAALTSRDAQVKVRAFAEACMAADTKQAVQAQGGAAPADSFASKLGELKNLYQGTEKPKSPADGVIYDLAATAFFTNEAVRLAGSGKAEAVGKIQGILQQAAATLDKSELASLQQSLDDICAAHLQGQTELVDAMHAFVQEKIDRLNSLPSLEMPGANVKLDANALQELPQPPKPEPGFGCAVVNDLILDAQKRRDNLLFNAVSDHQLKLMQLESAEKCQSPEMQEKIKQQSAAQLEAFRQDLSGRTEVENYAPAEQLALDRAEFELTAADFKTFKQELSGFRHQKLQNLWGLLHQPGSLPSAEGAKFEIDLAYSLCQSLGFDAKALNVLCDKVPDLLQKAVQSAGDEKLSFELLHELCFACRGDKAAEALLDPFCRALAGSEPSGELEKRLAARLEFDLGILHNAPQFEKHGITELQVKSAQDLKNIDSNKMLKFAQTLLSSSAPSNYKALNNTLGLYCVQLAYEAYCAEHSDTKKSPAEDRGFQEQIKAELPKYDFSLLNNKWQDLAQSGILRAFNLNPQRKMLKHGVFELESNAAARKQEAQIRAALAHLAGMNTQGSQLSSMPLGELTQAAAHGLPSALFDSQIKASGEALQFIENPDAKALNSLEAQQAYAFYQNTQALVQEQAGKLKALQGEKTSGETLAVSLELAHALLSESIDDLTDFELARFGLDREKLNRATDEERRKMLADVLTSDYQQCSDPAYQLIALAYVEASKPADTAAALHVLRNVHEVSGKPPIPDAALDELSDRLNERQQLSAEDKLALLQNTALFSGDLKADLKNFKTNSRANIFKSADDFKGFSQILADKHLSPEDKLSSLRSSFNQTLKDQAAAGHDLMGLSAAAMYSKVHDSVESAQNLQHALKKAGADSALPEGLSRAVTDRYLFLSDGTAKTEQVSAMVQQQTGRELKQLLDQKLNTLQAAACELTARALPDVSNGRELFAKYKTGTQAEQAAITAAIKDTLKQSFYLPEGTADLITRRIVQNYSSNADALDQLTSGLQSVKLSDTEQQLYEAAAEVYPVLTGVVPDLKEGQTFMLTMDDSATVSFDLFENKKLPVSFATVSASAEVGGSIGSALAISHGDQGFTVTLGTQAGVSAALSAEFSAGIPESINNTSQVDGAAAEFGVGAEVSGGGTVSFTFATLDDALLFSSHALCGLADQKYANEANAVGLAVAGNFAVGFNASISAGITPKEGSMLDLFELSAQLEAEGKWQFGRKVGNDGTEFNWGTKLALTVSASAAFNTGNVAAEVLSDLNILFDSHKIGDLLREGVSKDKDLLFMDREITVQSGRGGYPAQKGAVTYHAHNATLKDIAALCNELKLSKADCRQVLERYLSIAKSGGDVSSFTISAEFDFSKSPLSVDAAKKAMTSREGAGTLKFNSMQFECTDEKFNHKKQLSAADVVTIEHSRTAAVTTVHEQQLGSARPVRV